MDDHETIAAKLDRERKSGAYDRRLYFKTVGVDPPGDEYVTRDDVFRLSFWSPTAASTVRLSVRVLGPDGFVSPGFQTANAQTNGTTPTVLNLTNMEGFLLSASVTSPDALYGTVFVTLEIIRGQGSGDVTRGAVLLAGYPDQLRSIGYPETPVGSSLGSRGLMRIVTGAVPGAGAEIVDVVPAGRQWIVRSVRFQLTTNATVANRFVGLLIDDGAGNVATHATAGTAQTATLVWRYCFADGLNPVQVGTVLNAGFPNEPRLQPGFRILTSTQAIAAGDQYTAATYLVEEFISG